MGGFYNLYSLKLFYEVILIGSDPFIKRGRKVLVKTVILLLYILVVIKLSVNNLRYIVSVRTGSPPKES
jgi:hypothetical protein